MAKRALLEELIGRALELVGRWEESFGEYPEHAANDVEPERLRAAWEEFSERMEGNFPFFHPRFAGQMLKPPHPVAAAGYLAGLLVNPNNHALDAGPVTSQMEKEVVAALGEMFHLPAVLGHLTSSGTIANLEGLFVARQLMPGGRVVFGANAHYTHRRMCQLLGVEAVEVGLDASGRIDLAEVERECARGGVSAVVLTAGSTGRGLVDPIEAALELKTTYGVRLHVDAAYGGFFSLLAWDEETTGRLPAASIRAIAECDSVVVDPHKHGLQPYGTGAVLFADPAVGALYRHDSPYTYFTSDELHLGEISLECSRAGASAAALWLTLQALPLESRTGFGPILAASCRAAEAFSTRLAGSVGFCLVEEPELDIVTYYPYEAGLGREEVSSWSRRILTEAMQSDEPVWLSTLVLSGDEIARLASAPGGEGPMTVLRSVLMKPEHELWVDHLVARLSDLRAATARI